MIPSFTTTIMWQKSPIYGVYTDFRSILCILTHSLCVHWSVVGSDTTEASQDNLAKLLSSQRTCCSRLESLQAACVKFLHNFYEPFCWRLGIVCTFAFISATTQVNY